MVRVGPNQVDVSDIAAIKKIHRVKADFVKTDFYLGVGYKRETLVNTQDIEFHRRHRKLLSQPMSESSLKAMEPQIEEKVHMTIERMGQEMKTREVVDVHKWWMFMTADVIAQLTFGESFHMLENGKVMETLDTQWRIILMERNRSAIISRIFSWRVLLQAYHPILCS